jgi:hypothetical protein
MNSLSGRGRSGVGGVLVWVWVIGIVATAATGLLMWFRYLSFLRWLVEKTSDTKCLRDAAVAARAFPGAGVAGAIARAFRPDPVEEVAHAASEIVKGPEQPSPIRTRGARSGAPGSPGSHG